MVQYSVGFGACDALVLLRLWVGHPGCLGLSGGVVFGLVQLKLPIIRESMSWGGVRNMLLNMLTVHHTASIMQVRSWFGLTQ